MHIYNLYRYLNERVKLPAENILVVDIQDVWDDPEAGMRHVAQFLRVPWTDRFLHWDGIKFSYNPHPVLDHWVEDRADLSTGPAGCGCNRHDDITGVRGPAPGVAARCHAPDRTLPALL